MRMLTDHVIVDGRRLAYRCTPGTTGEAVVFVHGTPSHSFIWRNVIPDIEADGHGVLVFDLLGYGSSERPANADTSVAAQATLLASLLAALGITRCTLIAHDIGGAVAQIFATRHPERVTRMMLVDTVSYDSWPSETWREIIRDHLDRYSAMARSEFDELLTAQLVMTTADPARMSGPVLDAYLAPHEGSLGRMSFFEHQVRHYDSTPTEEIAGMLKDLPMPVRILWGALDRWQPVEYGRRLAQDIPRAELVVVPDAGHFLMEDAPERVVREVRHLLNTRIAHP